MRSEAKRSSSAKYFQLCAAGRLIGAPVAQLGAVSSHRMCVLWCVHVCVGSECGMMHTCEGRCNPGLEVQPPATPSSTPFSPGGAAAALTVVRLQLLLVHVDDVGAHAVEEIL